MPVTFTGGSKEFDTSTIRSGGGGNRRGPVIGGGIGAVAIALIAMFLSSQGIDANGLLDGITGGGQPESTSEATTLTCTYDQANTDRECRMALTKFSLDTYWEKELPAETGIKYVKPTVRNYHGTSQSACGTASNATGPFYCPPDQTIYIDVSFFDELVNKFGGSDGALAEEYVLAHEMGHHIEQLSGAMDQADRSGTGPDSDSVRIELMADCLAGMWADNATKIDRGDGKPFLQPITQQDLKDAMDAAAAVGDDHIQKEMTGHVNPEGFTHGTSAQRQQWFMTGYNGGTIATCNALNATKL